MLSPLLAADIPITSTGWFVLFIFLVVVACVIAFAVLHPKIPIPFTHPTRYIHLDHAHPPLAGVLLLWIVQCTSWSTIWQGITGQQTVEPYAILILFNSLAYVCISVDQTGIFAWIAIKIARKAGSSGNKLFLYFYATASVMAIITSNDVCILTMTPIIYYTCVCADQPPLPFLIAEYYAANIWSMTLYISSPTNIIVAQAEGITFLQYAQWMAFPSIVSGCTTYIMLYWWFRSEINPTFAPLQVDEKIALIDIRGAIFGTINLSINLFLLIIAEWLKPLQLWHICLGHAVIQLGYNLYAYSYHTHVLPPLSPEEAQREAKYRAMTANGPIPQGISEQDEQELPIAGNVELVSPASAHAQHMKRQQHQQQEPQQEQDQEQEQEQEHSQEQEQEQEQDQQSQNNDENVRSTSFDEQQDNDLIHNHNHTNGHETPVDISEPYDLQHEQAVARLRDQLRVKRTIMSAINSMPWRIIPYAGGMFILVNILQSVGWLKLLASGLVQTCTSPGACIWMFSWLSMFLDNTINDQPMSILISYVLLDDNFKANVTGGETGPAFRGAMWSAIMGSNLGACFTLIGALAGLMWAAILMEKGIRVTYTQFLKYSVILIPVCIVTTFAIQIEML